MEYDFTDVMVIGEEVITATALILAIIAIACGEAFVAAITICVTPIALIVWVIVLTIIVLAYEHLSE